ncbi:MAG: hypothetical protein GX346_00620 [Clostridiales bacterium]|nr:hypothetical protein [Clostridiales bacterium]
MIKLITGKEGSGKTKILIDAINKAEEITKGNVVAIQIGSSLNLNVSHRIRLINIEDWDINDYNSFYGLIAGVLASDYDVTHIFVDGIFRIVGRDYEKVSELFDKIDKITDDVEVTLTVSADESELNEGILKFKK